MSEHDFEDVQDDGLNEEEIYNFEDTQDELTEEEENKLKKHTNPDGDSLIKYNWAEEFQKNIIALLLNDRWFAVQCRDLINPNYFVDEVHQLLCRNLFYHLEKYKILPQKSFVIQEIESAIKNKEPSIKQHYIAETISLYEKYVPNLESREYLLEKILNFAKLMSLKNAFDSSLQLMKKDPEEESTWAKIQSILKDALLVDRNFDAGLNYFETIEERFLRMKKEEEAQERFTSGFESIDRALLGNGPHRGEIYSWVGLSGTGKSLALVSAAWRNISQLGKKVLYISLEMSEDKIAERFDAQISGVQIGKIMESSEIIRNALMKEVEGTDDKRLLVIKQFPAGTMTVNTLRAYMQQLHMIGFKPDLLIIDYIGEMKDYPGMPTYESRFRIVRDLRGLATEENICIFTAMQPNKNARDAQNKEGLGPGVIDDTNLADSYGQIRPLDGCWSINQMHGEKEAAIARIFVIKHRHGKSRFDLYVDYDIKISDGDLAHKGTLAMTEISKAEYDRRWKNYQMTKTETVGDHEKKEQEIYNKMKKGKKNKSKFQNDIGYNNEDLDKPDNLENGDNADE
jgi:replicative DNA helicase